MKWSMVTLESKGKKLIQHLSTLYYVKRFLYIKGHCSLLPIVPDGINTRNKNVEKEFFLPTSTEEKSESKKNRIQIINEMSI